MGYGFYGHNLKLVKFKTKIPKSFNFLEKSADEFVPKLSILIPMNLYDGRDMIGLCLKTQFKETAGR